MLGYGDTRIAVSTKIIPRTLILFKSKAKVSMHHDLKFVPYYEIFFCYSNFCNPFSLNFLNTRIKDFSDILGSGRNHHSYIEPPTSPVRFNSYPQQETAKFLRNVSNHLHDCIVSQLRRSRSILQFSQKPQTSYPLLFLNTQSNATHWLIL